MKTEQELMVKALELLAQLKGFNLNEIRLVSEMLNQQALNLQVFEPDSVVFDAVVQEWKDAYQKLRKEWDDSQVFFKVENASSSETLRNHINEHLQTLRENA